MTGRPERLRQALLRRKGNGSHSNGRELIPPRNSSTLPSVATVGFLGTSVLMLELTNAGTTFWALDNVLGDAGVLGVRFAILLTLGLAIFDTGGLYCLFRPEADAQARDFAAWSVMGAWLLCATSNAIMTWWTVASTMAVRAPGNAVLSQAVLMDVAPVFIALIVWLIRILLVAGYVHGESG